MTQTGIPTPRPVVIDTDPGVGDAWALLYLAPVS